MLALVNATPPKHVHAVLEKNSILHSQCRSNRALKCSFTPGLGVQDLHDSVVMLGVEPGDKLIIANRMASVSRI